MHNMGRHTVGGHETSKGYTLHTTWPRSDDALPFCWVWLLREAWWVYTRLGGWYISLIWHCTCSLKEVVSMHAHHRKFSLPFRILPCQIIIGGGKKFCLGGQSIIIRAWNFWATPTRGYRRYYCSLQQRNGRKRAQLSILEAILGNFWLIWSIYLWSVINRGKSGQLVM